MNIIASTSIKIINTSTFSYTRKGTSYWQVKCQKIIKQYDRRKGREKTFFFVFSLKMKVLDFKKDI